MGKLDDLLNKAQGLKAKESELFKETRIRMERNGQLKAKLIELQNNKKLLEILGNFPLKGKVISFYSMPMEAEETDEAPDDVEPDQKSLMVMYDFLERQVPYVHFMSAFQKSRGHWTSAILQI